MQQLPEELKAEIVNYLSPRDLSNLAVTNHAWKDRIERSFADVFQGICENANLDRPSFLGLLSILQTVPVAFQRASSMFDDVEIKDDEQKTALHYTAYCHAPSAARMVAALVRRGAFVDQYCSQGRTPAELAVENQNFWAARALIDHGAEITDDLIRLSVSTIRGKGHGGLVPDRHLEGATALQGDFISRIAQEGASMSRVLRLSSAHNYREEGRPALIHAVLDGEPSTVQLLIRLGVDVDCRCDHGRTALIWAAEALNSQCVAMLLEAGADINVTDDDGVSAGETLPLRSIDSATEDIWKRFLMRSLDINAIRWYYNYRKHASLVKIAKYEALRGDKTLQNLIAAYGNSKQSLQEAS
ncbi:ankyrin repeat-containing domain protein [Plectosphaerella cucumerina]|uniref:Ankyrin repeat-containing domain protein n=1 Tax=Plectosphaerella cucumerina TaxID=40658 RepID=A0A8K0TWK0_9PEZI|nr:ankyrin repeat-containing domain protein [Plectosphaerella cucumerina]